MREVNKKVLRGQVYRHPRKDITILGEIVSSRDYFFTNEFHVLRNNLKNSQEVIHYSFILRKLIIPCRVDLQGLNAFA